MITNNRKKYCPFAKNVRIKKCKRKKLSADSIYIIRKRRKTMTEKEEVKLELTDEQLEAVNGVHF